MCAAALTWDYELDPYRQQILLGREVVEAIGPAAVALSVAGLFLGAAAALTLAAQRRSGAAKGLAFLLALALNRALWLLPGMLNQEADSVVWSLHWITTGVCAVACAALTASCRRLIRRRPC